MHKLDEIITKKIVAFCKTLSFISSVKLAQYGSTDQKMIQLETKNRDLVGIMVFTHRENFVDFDGISARPSVTQNNKLYIADKGFVGKTDIYLLKKADAYARELVKSKKTTDTVIESYENGFVVYKKSKL
jgi:hypothetical protein